MSENNIVRLIAKFEESLEYTEKLANTMMGLEGALKSLDTSIYEIYELTKVEGITTKSTELLDVLENIKNTQDEINQEYDELINLKLYKDDIKTDIKEIKESIENLEGNLITRVNSSVVELKEEIRMNNIKIEDRQNEIREEILLAIKEIK